MSQQKDCDSLQQRVDLYLRGNPTSYVVEEPGEEAIDDIFDMVKMAEEELMAAQKRLERLKWELAKAQQKQAKI